ncbi:hypothetical protein SISSUDRAFT_572368 [Sistotremastrum suecicum HHB10207 ss-3]|uniref:Uncharacterized protein n=1 Tax=Sistotremastrum suecicum HHB10207 ss-3 TaxID=1314776 RepID=A0A166ES38_9AGAM|nr:hypothetical protein SISSUDRAFT_572368 [Sistotremastrum suecicum HHB10207 ss-3]
MLMFDSVAILNSARAVGSQGHFDAVMSAPLKDSNEMNLQSWRTVPYSFRHQLEFQGGAEGKIAWESSGIASSSDHLRAQRSRSRRVPIPSGNSQYLYVKNMSALVGSIPGGKGGIRAELRALLNLKMADEIAAGGRSTERKRGESQSSRPRRKLRKITKQYNPYAKGFAFRCHVILPCPEPLFLRLPKSPDEVKSENSGA